jgi:hypothetical protein
MPHPQARKTKNKPTRLNIPLGLDAALAAKVDDASARLGLSKQATMRLSIERGVDVLMSQLTGKASA